MSFAPSQAASNSAIKWARGDRANGPVLLDFSLGWGKGVVFDWYKRLRSTAVARIQLRKEFEEPFRHEFILVFLQGGSICRLDRRGDPSVPTQTLSSTGSEAYDTVHEIDSLDDIEPSSECLVELRPNGTIDLLFILSICFGIRSDPKTQRYTLQRFNCYFFSWTITSVVARHSVSWDTPVQLSASEQLIEVLKAKTVPPIAKKAAEITVKSASALFGCTLRPKIRSVLRKHLRPAGFIPGPVLNLALSFWMKRRMRPRIEALMRDVVASAMTSTLESTVEPLFDSRSSVMRSALSHTLWFDSVRETLGKTARITLRDAVWALVVKAFKTRDSNHIPVQQASPANFQSSPKSPPDIAPADSRVQAGMGASANISEEMDDHPKERRTGGLLDTIFVPGMVAITDDCYVASISSSWGMSEGLVGDPRTHEEWNRSWDQVWSTVFKQTLSRAQEVMSDFVRTKPPHAARDEFWSLVWEELELGFQSCGPMIRDGLWDAFELTTTTVVDIVSDAVFAAFQENRQYSLEATLNRTPITLKKLKDVAHVAPVNHAELQEWIKYRIQRHGDQISRLGLGSGTAVQSDIREAMGRVWEHVSNNEKAFLLDEDSIYVLPNVLKA